MTPVLDREEIQNAIAIVGMSGRFPGARNLDEFWRNLRDGIESISFFTDEELRGAGADPAARRDPDYVGAGGVLEGVDLFDAGFFGFNPREAETMDPQQRIFLETAWEALENAGYDPGKYAGSIGVYAGTGISTYFFNIYDNKELLNLLGGHQVMIGNDKDHLTTHASYKFDLRGPSVTVQTACSTSLVAVCMACRSLLDYQCDMALAGGSSIAIPQGRGYYHHEGGISSPDGHCRAFDRDARGTVAGNGAGVVLLKRLADAIADGDTVRAVIRGSAINNDGAVKVGYTAPSVEGQAEVVAMAQATAGVGAETITFIEAHGTGTPLGDPIEVAALAQVFAGVRRRHHCAIGSVKSNIGHLDTAAGIAGLIKAVLAMENKSIPATLHFEHANPKLELERTPFYISDRTHDWITDGSPRRAGVSSFGIGGTNAHVVLEEAPQPGAHGDAGGAHLITLSARSGPALEALTQAWVEHFRRHPETNVADAAFTSAMGRKEFRYRRAAVCSSAGEAAERLPASRVSDGGKRETIFLFPGQGSQYAGMTAGLYRDEPAFRQAVDRCLDILKRVENIDLYPVLYPDAGGSGLAEARIGETEYTQPALFVIEYALATLLIEWGVKPSAMAGHSIGEYVAACVAGVWSLEDALHLVCVRGRLMQTMPRGAMLAAALSEGQAQRWLSGELSLAAINAHDQAVFSGPEEEIAGLAEGLREHRVEVIKLRTSHAFHSGMMDRVMGEFERVVRGTAMRAPAIPFVSNVTGEWISDAQATDPAYWSRQLRATVRFADAIDKVLARPGASIVEVGPGQTLTGLVRGHARYVASTPALHSVRGRKDQREDRDVLLTAVAGLWTGGATIDWKAFYAGVQRSRIPLPTYPFERKRYWIDPAAVQTAPRVQGRTALMEEWFYLPQWKRAGPVEDGGAIAGRSWLVLSEGELGSAIARRIRALGGTVATVELNAAVTQESFDSLVARAVPDAIVHCWLADNAARSFDEWQALGFHAILRLTRSLLKVARRGETILNVVSRNVYPAMGDEALEPAKAAVLGPCRVIPQEHPGIRTRSIDIDTGDGEQMADAILQEIATGVSDPVVAIRNGRRWLPVFDHARWSEAPDKSLFRRRGVYLITGGFGNVGITMAETLARHFAARIALVGRTKLPPETEWEGCELESVRAVRELRALGAEVMPICCDCADPEQLQAAFEKVKRHFGRVDGVIHAAAEMDSAAFQPALATTAANAELHFRNKAKSALALRDIIAKQPVSFCMLVSSLSSVLGGLNFSAYAGANAVLDCLAEEQNGKTGTRWISVNWDGWRFGGEQPSSNEYYLAPDEGAAAFRRICEHSGGSQVVVSTGDLDARLDRWVGLKAIGVQAGGGDLTPAHPRPEVTTEFAAPQTAVEQMIADVWQLVLGVSSVGIHDNFFELGGHSLLAIQLVSRLRDLFQEEIALTAIFDYPTLQQLAAHVEAMSGNGEEQMARLAQMLDYVEQLSAEEVEALLAGEARP